MNNDNFETLADLILTLVYGWFLAIGILLAIALICVIAENI